eukprot:TRINITY_DN10904_c0_g1_i2.p1 TRINITY_DN10904_c0_g1~~TRINITY_DN10904_c0_g1_i2.p1  ORF type:complete len:250 (+),score=52.71 TRINITY_DN10904_c0_g1_i2:201-950(+)
MRLGGKVALITSGASGVGYFVSVAFAREGCSVIAIDKDPGLLHKLKAESPGLISTVTMGCMDSDGMVELASQIDRLDILVNTCSIMSENTAMDCPESTWDHVFDVNVKSMFLTSQAVLPLLTKDGAGSIINFSSVASSLSGVPSRCAYAASKAAVIGLTKSIATDFIKTVRCNAICLGTIEAPDLDERIEKLGGDPSEIKKMFCDQTPMGRLGSMQEVASLCVYLGSDESAYMTGQVQVLDGGAGLTNV